jgi:hypothetical protein
MAYENTQVSVTKSQDKIRQLILRNKGTGIAFISQPPMEGFQALMPIDGKTYTIRISAHLNSKRDAEKECRRIWRVLFHHLKDIFEASNSGVMEFRELILPYIVTHDGQTVAQHILPRLDLAINGSPERMLPAPREKL